MNAMSLDHPHTPPLSEKDGFIRFARLLMELGETGSTREKNELLVDYFSSASPQDKAWTLGLFTGRRLRRQIRTRQLAEWLTEWHGIPSWLFEESYHHVGDLAETLALLDPSQPEGPPDGDLSDYLSMLQGMSGMSDEEKGPLIRRTWSKMDRSQKFVFNKLLTGGFRVGVSAQLIMQALAKVYETEPAVIAHRISGTWDPAVTDAEAMLRGEGRSFDLSRPYPFFLAYPVEAGPDELGHPSEWHAEWKWDGIRGQTILRSGIWSVWSRGEELMTDKFPEFDDWRKHLPDGTVLDGEIMAMRDGKPLPFALLQTRIGRTRLSARLLKDAPVGFMAFDLLECNGEDWRSRPFSARRARLKEIVDAVGQPGLQCSETVPFADWEALTLRRREARERGSEGLMLKRLRSGYQAGRKRGDWWKWKLEPMTVDAVLVYAQKGHGRRSNLYTDYTFAVKDGDRLVVFAKAYSGLTDKEFREVDAFVKRNAIEKFGPVRTVRPELVFEIAFEGISESRRHKAGIAVRFPRIHRWRTDKTADDINTLDDMKRMLELYGSLGTREITQP
jgi:DNA ligase-1